jgi:Ca2+/H+ antiporter, TMEM165/GDT1 family
MLEAFLTAAAAIFIAELGDKTQLFALTLAAKTHRPWSVLGGVSLGAFVLIAPAAWLGFAASQYVDAQHMRYVSAALLFAFALWMMLRGADDEDDDPDAAQRIKSRSAIAVFSAAALGFALAELGDKSQIAVVLLGARAESVWPVIAGAWLGEVAAIAPAALLGKAIAARVSARKIGWLAGALFAALGVWTLLGG